jgi:metal iron transporter
MPHSLFLGSALATQDRLAPRTPKHARAAGLPLSVEGIHPDVSRRVLLAAAARSFWASTKASLSLRREDDDGAPPALTPDEHANHSQSFVRAHLRHAVVDVVASLLGFAVLINAAILVLAAAVFFYGPAGPGAGAASLFDAHALVREIVGPAAAALFAVALLLAGQSSALIATAAGQVVAEGLVRLRLGPAARRLSTRALAIVPALVIACARGRAGINDLLVVSQVVLAVVLPFVTLPLLLLTSSKRVMSVRRELAPAEPAEHQPVVGPGEAKVEHDSPAAAAEAHELVSYANGRIVQTIGWVFWVGLVLANVYVLVELGLGQGG